MSVDRGFTWLDDETSALIQIWGKDDIQNELSTAKRNFSVYERIARELSEVGFSRTAYQCREKIKRLRKEYQIARYCVQHNISQKKPMKYYEQVDQVFSRESDPQNQDLHNVPYSDPEEEWHFNLKTEFDSSSADDNERSGNQPVILSGPSSSSSDGGLKMRVRMKSEEPSHDSNDTLIDNGEDENASVETANPVSELEENPPWVPNVVLVENDESSTFDNVGVKSEVNDQEESRTQSSASANLDPTASADEEPSHKRPRYDNPKVSWFKTVMDRVTEKFLSYQEIVDSRFLERIASLEKERIKRDEAIQKLWMEFEERRRKEEQQHELKMMSLFGQFVSQILCNEDADSK